MIYVCICICICVYVYLYLYIYIYIYIYYTRHGVMSLWLMEAAEVHADEQPDPPRGQSRRDATPAARLPPTRAFLSWLRFQSQRSL